MKNYIMRLAEEPFRKIKQGKKTVECRLLDEKRRKIKVGDVIKFRPRNEESEKIITEVVGLEKFKTFSELIDKVGTNPLGGGKKPDLLSELGKFYSSEEENKYSVLAISIKLVE